ncbi:hypothetical protein BP5796_03408 [Coleophoma crateriformis]|uniref:Rhodopsin family protein n=1 Tax=Coleophoma crateriformis TaxID=565419 RepID=A0A3D8SNF0_9HELO|nr:hypothetical protein BP5796_03408 [Coleophoma crateriformis]
MCIVFTCGEHEFSKQLQGYESVVCQCHNCVSHPLPSTFLPRVRDFKTLPLDLNFTANAAQGNFSARVIKRHPWFTFCFVPVVPLSVHGYEDVVCNICKFAQPLQARQDVIAQVNGGGGPPQGYQLQQGPPQGWGGHPPGPPGPPKQQNNMQYG